MSDTPDDPENTGRDQAGRWTAGNAGNIAGKPKGARNKVSLLLDKMAAADAADVLRAVLTKAKAGDLHAAATVLARLWPARRGRPVMLDLPAITNASDVTAALSAIMAAIGRGDITPDEASGIAAVIEASRKSIETTELAERIAALEAHANGRR